MDDILIGVSSIDEGERCINRLQLSLEALGLYPNAAKTMIVPIDEHLREAMLDVNADIERLNQDIDKHDSGSRPQVINAPNDLLVAIEQLSEEHRNKSTARN